MRRGVGLKLIQTVGNKENAINKSTISGALDFKVTKERIGAEKI